MEDYTVSAKQKGQVVTPPRSAVSVLLEETYHVEQIHNHWINTDNREMWIHGIEMNTDSYEGFEPGVEYMMATKVIKNLHILKHQSAVEPVTIHLHTCGGMWEEGIAIYDSIKAMPYHVDMICYTHARSMSSIILQAADRRIMMPNSYFMFHLGTLGMEGEVRTVQSTMDFTAKQTKTMIDIYVEVASKSPKFKGKSKKKIRRAIERAMEKKSDVFLTPEEAIEWGFADEILTSWKNWPE